MTAEDIIHDLLENPYPHDLVAIRKLADSYGSEEEAKEKMIAYCTTKFLIDALNEYYAARNMAKDWLRDRQGVS